MTEIASATLALCVIIVAAFIIGIMIILNKIDNARRETLTYIATHNESVLKDCRETVKALTDMVRVQQTQLERLERMVKHFYDKEMVELHRKAILARAEAEADLADAKRKQKENIS